MHGNSHVHPTRHLRTGSSQGIAHAGDARIGAVFIPDGVDCAVDEPALGIGELGTVSGHLADNGLDHAEAVETIIVIFLGADDGSVVDCRPILAKTEGVTAGMAMTWLERNGAKVHREIEGRDAEAKRAQA